MGAFRRARDEGATAIELDARTCASGEVVVFHDESLRRMTAGQDARLVADVSLDDLRRIDLGGARVPALSEVLQWARSEGVAVNVEMKHEVPNRLALARGTVRALRASRADVLLSSFDPALLAAAAMLAPTLRRALLVHDEQGAAADILQEIARPPWVHAIHLERTQVDRDGLRRALQRRLRVGVWTVNDPDEARDLVGLGVASIITDCPGAILAALRT
jgi:glycerophosphoryl diester phosphodiesterase